MLKGLVIGFVLAVILLAGGAYYYFSAGLAPVATADPPMPFERKFAHMALNAHIEKQTKGEPPVAADQTTYLAGADVYKQHCAVCHGVPDQPSEYATTMFPGPPQLFKGKGVMDDPASETYWKTANGIRLTGMPGFKTKLTDTQMWQVSQLLAHASEISGQVKKTMVPNVAPPMPSDGPSPVPMPKSK